MRRDDYYWAFCCRNELKRSQWPLTRPKLRKIIPYLIDAGGVRTGEADITAPGMKLLSGLTGHRNPGIMMTHKERLWVFVVER